MLSLTPLNSIEGLNVMAAEFDDKIGDALAHLEGSDGKQIAEKFLKESDQIFSRNKWFFNSHRSIDRVATDLCGSFNVQEIFEDNVRCKLNLKILPAEMCNSIPHEENFKFFNEDFIEEVLVRLKNSLVVRVWDDLNDNNMTKDSNNAFMQLARTFCPKTFEIAEYF